MSKYFPQIAGMHPQDAYPLIATKLVYINLILLLFSLTGSFFKYTNTKFLYPLVLLATFFIVPSYTNNFVFLILHGGLTDIF